MILALPFVCAVDFVFAPWSYYLGGRMHVLPFWQGIGRMQTSAGNYTLYLWFAPTPGGTTLHLPSVDGWGYLCTPRGDRFVLRATGGFLTQTGMDTNGKEMHLSLRQRPWNAGFLGRYDGRPRLELRGRWRNPNLELDDGGSLSQAFVADGTLFSGPARDRPNAREPVALVLHETVWSGWINDCRPRT